MGLPESPESTGTEKPRPTRGPLALLVAVGLVALAAVGLAWLYSGPALSPVDAEATREAGRFATAQIVREATQVSQRRTRTAQARITGTAAALAQGTRNVLATRTAQVEAANIATAVAGATHAAWATRTAEIVARDREAASALATATALEGSAGQVFGPSSGELAYGSAGTAVCDKTELRLRDFIASARFISPDASAWDYGIAFENLGDDSRFSLAVDSSSHYALRLQAPGYYIQSRGETDLIDLSRRGSNSLKLYLAGDTLLVLLNGHYLDLLDLTSIAFGQSTSEEHGPMICVNLGEVKSGTQYIVPYEEFTVWALP